MSFEDMVNGISPEWVQVSPKELETLRNYLLDEAECKDSETTDYEGVDDKLDCLRDALNLYDNAIKLIIQYVTNGDSKPHIEDGSVWLNKKASMCLSIVKPTIDKGLQKYMSKQNLMKNVRNCRGGDSLPETDGDLFTFTDKLEPIGYAFRDQFAEALSKIKSGEIELKSTWKAYFVGTHKRLFAEYQRAHGGGNFSSFRNN